MKIPDVYAPDIMRGFRNLHTAYVTGNVTWQWSCTCGGHSPTGTTQGRATAARDRHLRAEHKRYIAELENGATHVVEYHDASWGGWRRADAFGDRPEAEFPIRGAAVALARDMLGYVRRVRIRSTWAGGTETITEVRP